MTAAIWTNVTITLQKILGRFGYAVLRQGTLQELNQQLEQSRFRIHHLESQPSYLPVLPPMPAVAKEFASTGSGTAALERIISDYQFHTVMDIGAGSQLHSKAFASHGKAVTAVDFGRSVYHQHKIDHAGGGVTEIVGDFNELSFDGQFDCVWASHVLEHQLNVGLFLEKIASILKEGGVLAITVPPMKHEIVGGHVSLWNGGLILYRLILAGFDCSRARVLAYGYNISVIVEKRTIPDLAGLRLEFDAGDIRKLLPYFPPSIHFLSNATDDPFDGDLRAVNW